MYASPVSPSSPRFIGAVIASVVTSGAIYATSLSHIGFGHFLSKPVDFVSSMSSEASSAGEPETVMVPDTAIPAQSPSSGPSQNVVRESRGRIQTIIPAGSGGAQSGWSFNLRPPRMPKPGVVQPTLKSTAAPAGVSLPSLTAGDVGTTTMSYCVTSAGRVRDAKVTASSRYTQLDDAALDWLRTREFEPGTIRGAPADMCGLIDYRWRLNAK